MALTTQLEFYRARAEQCRVEADAATLDNVRDRCLRAEEAWIRMAERVERTEAMRRDKEETHLLG